MKDFDMVIEEAMRICNDDDIWELGEKLKEDYREWLKRNGKEN